ncbi:DUF3850 domain-containing protein [Flavobacterium rakeshii]|uniref:DUF3850 domain-containing protein n=1 Tax=Flavobacterium rakeshii TaxID=1038845 RepID=UPI002E7C33CB|nr:DUF3850 domain-containing protein [Flavobacterium rakeshii]MEE1897096.1 DUF3850 domain-containing protein [Flavobacterium rakeshii]
MKTHTKAEGIAAMNNLIEKTGLQKSDFYMLEEWEAREFGLEPNTPCVVTNDDQFITAFDHWQNYLCSIDEEEQDKYIEYCMDKCFKTHELKTLPEYFEAVHNGTKNFEVRKNDRDFKLGDTLILKEFIPKNHYGENKPIKDTYTGRELQTEITYILPLQNLIKTITLYSVLSIGGIKKLN